jgi:hypothetical protein
VDLLQKINQNAKRRSVEADVSYWNFNSYAAIDVSLATDRRFFDTNIQLQNDRPSPHNT